MLLALALLAMQRMDHSGAPVLERATTSAVGPPYSVVIVVLDDVSIYDLALYGGPVATTYLDALAQVGMVFNRAYSNPTCAPTRRSLNYGHWWITGNGDTCSDVPDANTPTPAQTSLAEALPGHASAFFGKWHLGTGPFGAAFAPITEGYDYYVQGMDSNVSGCGSVNYQNWLSIFASSAGSNEGQSFQYEPLALQSAFLNAFPTAPQPNLTVFNCNLAHSPFHAPPPEALPQGYLVPMTARAKYEAMIVAYDRIIGAMLSKIDLATTVVIVVGDNGTPPSVNLSPYQAKGTTFEHGVRVPLLIAGGPTVVGINDELVHVVDIYETVVELGLGTVTKPTPFPRSGKSLVPSIKGESHPLLHDRVLIGNRWGATDGDRAVVSADGLKLRQVDNDGDGIPDSEGLYNLGTDPFEQSNLIGDPSYAVQAQDMRTWLAANSP